MKPATLFLSASSVVVGVYAHAHGHHHEGHMSPRAGADFVGGTCAPLNQTWTFLTASGNVKPGSGKAFNILGGFGSPGAVHGKAKNGQPLPGGPFGKKRPRNFIFAIPDGFGPASELMARDYLHWKHPELGWNAQLPADSIQIGSVRTRSSNSYVTDSAAAATAYSCAIKSYNGAIGVDQDGNPCGTVLEGAKAAGYKTGIVVTSRVTHATPAAFYSHIFDRDLEPNIALQVAGMTPLGRSADVVMGGGLGNFLPNTTAGSLRKDGTDVVQIAKNNGFQIITDRAGFDALNKGKSPQAAKPYLAMFANGHMNYEVDRVATVQPSLLEMVKTAITSLEQMTKGKKKGFFIMIEASLIDRAGHGNDLVAHLHDILEYQNVVDWVKGYVDRHSDTTFISCADHETGGLSLGGIASNNQEYMWDPAPLDAGKHSAGYLAQAWALSPTHDEATMRNIFAQYGIFDANSTEISDSMALVKDPQNMEVHIGQSLSRRGLIKWSTLGHSAVDVSLIGHGLNSGRLSGNRDNTEIGQFIVDQLGLDLPAVTKKLNDPVNEAWLHNEVGRDYVQGGKYSINTPVSLGRRSRLSNPGHHH